MTISIGTVSNIENLNDRYILKCIRNELNSETTI